MKIRHLFIFPFLAASGHATLVAMVGMNEDVDHWPVGDGGGPNATFVQEAGVNDLPGDPLSPEVNQQADDDYYFAGKYTTVLDGGTYTPIGDVALNEEAAERAFAGADNSLRYHLNLPSFVSNVGFMTVSWDANNLHTDGQADPRYGVEVYFNGTKVADEVIIRPAELGITQITPGFTLDSVNGMVGEGFDNYMELRGINYNDDGGGNWMGVDYVQLDFQAVPEPSTGAFALLGLFAVLPVFRRNRR